MDRTDLMDRLAHPAIVRLSTWSSRLPASLSGWAMEVWS